MHNSLRSNEFSVHLAVQYTDKYRCCTSKCTDKKLTFHWNSFSIISTVVMALGFDSDYFSIQDYYTGPVLDTCKLLRLLELTKDFKHLLQKYSGTSVHAFMTVCSYK